MYSGWPTDEYRDDYFTDTIWDDSPKGNDRRMRMSDRLARQQETLSRSLSLNEGEIPEDLGMFRGFRLPLPPWLARRRRALKVGGVGMLGAVVVALVLLSNGGEADTQTLDTTAATTQETDPLATDGAESVAEPDTPLSPNTTVSEDLDAIAGSPQFFDCPIGYQLDIIRRLLSGKDGEQSEHIAETPEAKGSNLACTKYNKRNPHVFALIVEGDGESLSTADNTSYQVRFVVNNEWPLNEYYDDTGFEVLVEWNSLAKQWVGVVRDQQGTRVGNDADVTIEWLDSSTLQVEVDVPGLDVEVTEMRTELNVYVTDDNDVRQYDNFDVAIWHKES